MVVGASGRREKSWDREAGGAVGGAVNRDESEAFELG